MKLAYRILHLPFHIIHYWGYPVIFLFSLFEASPFLGLLVPGQTIVILGGFFAKLGMLNIYYVIILSSIGAVVGDLVGYVLGRKYGYSFITTYGKYFFFRKEYFKTTKKLMNEHTGKTIIIGRFNSVTRAFAPFVAGSSKVSLNKFLVYNIIGGVSWGIFFSLVGYIFGKSYELASAYIDRFLFIFVIAAVLAAYFYIRYRKRKKSMG